MEKDKNPPRWESNRPRILSVHQYHPPYLLQGLSTSVDGRNIHRPPETTHKAPDIQSQRLLWGSFGRHLQRIPRKEDRVYRVEEVLKTRKKGKKKQLYVKWVGYPKQFNSWIWEEDMV